MKKETIMQGYALANKLETVQAVKELLSTIDRVELSISSKGRIIDVAPERGTVVINNVSGNREPERLLAAINEETIRYIQRLKKLCDHAEFKLAQELEDL